MMMNPKVDVPPGMRPYMQGPTSREKGEHMGKVPQYEANYREGDEEHRCERCANYIPEMVRCQIVAGRIDPNGVSDYFEPQGEEEEYEEMMT